MEKIKIAYFINDMIVGGAENLLWNLVEHLDHSLFSCSVVYMFGKNEFTVNENVKYTALGLEPKRIYKKLKNMKTIWNYFNENKYDILHTHLCYADTYGQFIGATQSIPLVYTTIHNIVEWNRDKRTIKTLAEDRLLRTTDRVISVSTTLKDEIVLTRHCPPEKITVLYNGLDLFSFTRAKEYRAQTRSELGIEMDDYLVLCTAQFREEKRHDLLLQAFRELLCSIPNAKLLLVGSNGRLKEAVIRWIKNYDLSNAVLIRSGDKEAVARFCGAADAFTMHSEHEGYSLALVEALASGLPAVVPNIPVFVEGVTDGIDGYLFEFGDPSAQSNALQKIWSDIKSNNIFWGKTASRTQDQFSIKNHVQNLTNLYLNDLHKKHVIR